MSQGLAAVAIAPGAVATGEVGAWTATSELNSGRGFSSAVVLDGPACRSVAPAEPAAWCGRVLAAGGLRGQRAPLRSAELYDPATGRWTFTGNLQVARYGHTTTLLDGPACRVAAPAAPASWCGKVLVAGGATRTDAGRVAVDSAELYDPATGTWTATGRMGALAEAGGIGEQRFLHTAAALDGPACRGNDPVPLGPPAWCGKVLAVGGLGVVPDSSRVETLAVAALGTAVLYDPATGTWAATGRPAFARVNHTLTALDHGPCDGTLPPLYCGRLLLAGGQSAEPVAAGIPEAELYDPDAGQWLPTGPMTSPRIAHGAALLGGPVCRQASPQCNKVLVTGGILQASVVNPPPEATAELYDPLTGTWLPTGPMQSGRAFFLTLTVLDGPACRRAPTPPAAHCGKLVLTGGEPTTLVPPEVYDPATGAFTPTLPRLSTARGHAALLDGPRCQASELHPSCGRVLVFGDPHGSHGPRAELFDGSATSQPLTVVTIEPRSGPVEGGTEVRLSGAGFTGATQVRFGDVPALFVDVVSPTKLVATTRAMAPGTMEVTVVGPTGTSAATTTTRFTVFRGTHEWAATGSVVQARSVPTATALLDGRVLLVGGASMPNFTAVDSAELFDPASGQWDPAAAPATARVAHTATRLADGRVLVAGGSGLTCCPGPSLGSAEVFDPATGLWSATGSMRQGRALHTATLLPSGEVLVAGGTSGTGGVFSSAEMYDPDAVDSSTGVRGTWTTVAPMRSFRRSHEAVPLPDGRVLVVGGRGCDAAPTSPVPGSSSEPSCGEPGPQGFPDSDVERVVDPTGNVVLLRSAEVYDPSAGAAGGWAATGWLSAPRSHHTVTGGLPGGGVLVAGGCTFSECGHREAAEVYEPDAADPSTGARGAWRTAPGMARPRYDHAATLLEGPTCEDLCGRVLVAGGRGAAAVDSDVELLDPVAGTWEPAPSMLAARYAHRAISLPSGEVLVLGGVAGPDLVGTAEVFRPESGAPVVLGVDPPAGAPGTAVVIRGTDLSETTLVKFGDVAVEPVAGGVTERAVVAVSPAHPRGTVAVSVVSLLGESTNNPLSAADDFTYASGRWEAGGSMVTARFLHTSTLLDGPECGRAGPPSYCGRVLAAGGTTDFAPFDELVPHESAEVYDPEAGTWSTTGSMRSPRFNHTATLLDGPACRGGAPPPWCGKVLVAGGLVGTLAIDDAELYDPGAGTWTRTGSLGTERMSHTATLLGDGRVLVAGGAPDEPTRAGLVSAEIYDPGTGTWQPTAPLRDGRNSHTATLLADGQVLVAGGLAGTGGANELVDAAEVYDPAAGTWTAVAPMAVGRFAHAAVRLDGPRCGSACGKVLVVGGVAILRDERTTFHASAELFDPATRTWSAVRLPGTARGGHTAAVLTTGEVLVAGRAMTFPADSRPSPVASTELFDPLTGRWSFTAPMGIPRGLHGVVALDGPACRRPHPPAYCGTALVTAGATVGTGSGSGHSPLAVSSTERYLPAPDVHGVDPPGGSARGGTTVVLAGGPFAGVTEVRFGGVPAAGFVVDSPTSITAVSPPAAGSSAVEVTLVGPGGSSARIGGNPAASYAYLGLPGSVPSLAAQALSSTAVELTFGAADDGNGSSPAQAYEVRQSSDPVTEADFDGAGPALCGGLCRFGTAALTYRLRVDDLEPGRTYHYAVRAVNDHGRGPVSASVSVTTPATHEPSTACAEPPADGVGTVVYPGLRYSLVGLPEGTVVGSSSPLYSWSDIGAGGVYSIFDGRSPVSAGKGYWAFFRCPTEVSLATVRSSSATARLPLGAYHASMVGNPSAGAATVTGHDFAATWEPSAAGGAGGYRLSGYREPVTLNAGHGAWTFAYDRTEIRIDPAR